MHAAELVREWFYTQGPQNFLLTVTPIVAVAKLLAKTRQTVEAGTSSYHALLRGILALHDAQTTRDDVQAVHKHWQAAAHHLLQAAEKAAESGVAQLTGSALSHALTHAKHDPTRMPYARMLLGLTLSHLLRCPISVQLTIYASAVWKTPSGLHYDYLRAYWRAPDNASDAVSETATLCAINQLWATDAIWQQIDSVLQDADAAPHMAAGCARWLANHGARSPDMATQRRVLTALMRCAEHHAPTWQVATDVCEQALRGGTAETTLDTSADTADFFVTYVTCLQHTQALPFAAQPQLWQRLTAAGVGQLAATCDGTALVKALFEAGQDTVVHAVAQAFAPVPVNVMRVQLLAYVRQGRYAGAYATVQSLSCAADDPTWAATALSMLPEQCAVPVEKTAHLLLRAALQGLRGDTQTAVFTTLLAHFVAQKSQTPDLELRALCWQSFAGLPPADQAVHARSLLKEAPGSLPALMCYVQSAQFRTCVTDGKWLRKLTAAYALDTLETLLLQHATGPAAAIVLSLLEAQPTLPEHDPDGTRRQLWAAAWFALAPHCSVATTRATCLMESLIAVRHITQEATRAQQFASQYLRYTDDIETIQRLYDALDPQFAAAARDTVLCRLCVLLMARKAYPQMQRLTQTTALPAAAQHARALALAHLGEYDALWEALREAPPSDNATCRQALIAILNALPTAAMQAQKKTRTPPIPTPLCAWLSLATLLAHDAQGTAAITVLLDAVPTTARQSAMVMPAGVLALAQRIYAALTPAEQAPRALAVLQRFPQIFAALTPYLHSMKTADACGSNRKWLKEVGLHHTSQQLTQLLDSVDDIGAAYVLTMLEAHVPGHSAPMEDVQRAYECGRRWLTLHDKGVFAPARSRAAEWLTYIATPMLQCDDEALKISFAVTFCASTDDVMVRYKTLGKYLAAVEQIDADELRAFVCAKLLATRKEANYRSIVELTRNTVELSHDARRSRLFALVRLREHAMLAQEIETLPTARENAAYGVLWDALADEIRTVNAPVSAKKATALAHLNLHRHELVAAMRDIIAAMQLPDADGTYLQIFGSGIHQQLVFAEGLLTSAMTAEITQLWLWVAPQDFAALQILLTTGAALPKDLLHHLGAKQTSDLAIQLHQSFSGAQPPPITRFHIAQIAEAVVEKSQALCVLLAREWAALAVYPRAGHACIRNCMAALAPNNAEPPLHPDERLELEELIVHVCEGEDDLDTQIIHFYQSVRALSEKNRKSLAAHIWTQRAAFCRQLLATQRYPEVLSHTHDDVAYAADKPYVEMEREIVALRCQAFIALADYEAACNLARGFDMYPEISVSIFDAVTKNPGIPATIPAPAADNADWFAHVLPYLTHAQRAMVMAFDLISRGECGVTFWGRIEWIRYFLPDHVDEWLLPRLRRTLQASSEQAEKFVPGNAEYSIAKCFAALLDADPDEDRYVAQQVNEIVTIFAQNTPDSLFKTQPAEWIFGACLKSVQARHAACAHIAQLDPLLPAVFGPNASN
ncbi:hypothetical protein [Novosphingobium sp.]|uniref:hypothetical protein n=1 Tax=Novosphingobium sp. TaxID=1874826 RepID=UPI003D0A6BA4